MKILKKLLSLVGFEKSSPYVKKYINDSNVRSAIFMAAVVVFIEIWLFFRQIFKYVVKAETFDQGFSNLNVFILYLLLGVAVFVFSLNFVAKPYL